MFVDGQAWFTADSIETDAPIASDAHIYGATDTYVIGTVGGDSFAFVFDGTEWHQTAVGKPVDQWTSADYDVWDAAHPAGQFDDGSWLAQQPDNPPDATAPVASTPVSFVPLTIDMGILALSDGLLS